MRKIRKEKTILDRSMKIRKKIFFEAKRDLRMRRWTENAEWYTDMPLDLYDMCGVIDFVDILFPSKKYRKINYYAHLRTAEKTAQILLTHVMEDMTARLLGYENYREYCGKNGKNGAKPAPRELEGMSFYEILYTKIWPEVEPEIKTYTPPVYGCMELSADRYCLTLTKTLNCVDFGICDYMFIDDFVNDFIEGGEKIGNRASEENLFTPNWRLLKMAIDSEAKSYLR